MYLGIDLGTSNSAVAGFIGPEVRVFRTTDGSDYLPSAIYVDRRGNRQCGRRAYDQQFLSPENVAVGFKRLMGTKTSLNFAAAGLHLSAEECSAEIIRQLVGQALTESGQGSVTACVITIPAAFNQMQCESTVRAARMAELDQVALLQEPIAASMAAMARMKAKSGQFLVYDLGGGTFDLALVQGVSGSVSVLAHEGENMLGGRDIDRSILNSIVRPWLLHNFKLPEDFSKSPEYQRLLRMARFAVERAKIALSTSDMETIAASEEEVRVKDTSGADIYLQIDLSRKQIEELTRDAIDRTLELSRKILKDNGYTHDDIDSIVFIGGPTKMPVVRDRVPRELGIPADLETDPMTAVALGAAIFCESRDWGASGSTEKSSRGSLQTTGDLSIRYDYPARTPDDCARIRIRTDGQPIPTGCEILFTTQTGWTSGRMNLVDGLSVEVPLQDIGTNTIRAEAYDSGGRPLPSVSQVVEITRCYASASGIPATQTISVKVVDGSSARHNALEPLVKKGTPLPASGTTRFRAARELRAGEPDFLALELFQDEGAAEVDLNLFVGAFRITGKDLPPSMRIRVGDPIEIKWYMSDSGLLTATIDLPSVAQSFTTPRFYSPEAGHVDFKGTIGTRIAEEVLDRAESELHEAEVAIGSEAHQELGNIRSDIAAQRQQLTEAIAEEDIRAVNERARRIRQDLSRLRHEPRHRARVYAERLTRLQAEFNSSLRAKATADSVEAFDLHAMHAQKALVRGDERSVRDLEIHIEEMEQIELQELWRDPRFLILVYQNRLERRHLASDQVEFDRLARQAAKAIEIEDADALRNALGQIDCILVRVAENESDIAKLASLMKG